jgi:hypothetical protein
MTTGLLRRTLSWCWPRRRAPRLPRLCSGSFTDPVRSLPSLCACPTSTAPVSSSSSSSPAVDDYHTTLGNQWLKVEPPAAGRGRWVSAVRDIPAGTVVLECLPLAKVRKTAAKQADSDGTSEVCANCFASLGTAPVLLADSGYSSNGGNTNVRSARYCCDACRASAWAEVRG